MFGHTEEFNYAEKAKEIRREITHIKQRRMLIKITGIAYLFGHKLIPERRAFELVARAFGFGGLFFNRPPVIISPGESIITADKMSKINQSVSQDIADRGKYFHNKELQSIKGNSKGAIDLRNALKKSFKNEQEL